MGFFELVGESMEMARELDAILDRGEADPAPSCTNEDGVVSYLKQVICPIYETMQDVSKLCALWLYLYSLFNMSYTLDELNVYQNMSDMIMYMWFLGPFLFIYFLV